jgi:hypothetical protein
MDSSHNELPQNEPLHNERPLYKSIHKKLIIRPNPRYLDTAFPLYDTIIHG